MEKKLRSNVERANLAKVFMYIVLGASTLMLFVEVYTFFLYRRIFNDYGTVSWEEVDMVDNISIAVNGIYLISLLLSGIFFIMWFRRAYYNLHQLQKGLRFTEGWAAGAWFVPILNWFRPYQIATDLYTNTENLLIANKLSESNPKIHSIKGWWWGLWVSGNIIGNISAQSTEAMVMFSAGTAILSSLLFIGAGVLCLKVIDNYHTMEVRLKNIENVSQTDPNNSDLLDN